MRRFRAPRGWRLIVDNAMRAYGETDFDTRTIHINVALHKSRRESLIDTLVHEYLHAAYPRYGEKRICALTQKRLKTMPKKQKTRLYRLIHPA